MCRFRGQEMHVEDALMELTDDELAEVEVDIEDGVIRPFRDKGMEITDLGPEGFSF